MKIPHIFNCIVNITEDCGWSLITFRSSHRRCSVKKVFLEISQIHRKTPVPESLFNKVAGLRSATFLKKKLWRSRLLVNFAKFLRTPFQQNTSGRPLLHVEKVKTYFIFTIRSLITTNPPRSLYFKNNMF